MLMCCITLGVNLDCLVEVISVRFLHCKVTIFPPLSLIIGYIVLLQQVGLSQKAYFIQRSLI